MAKYGAFKYSTAKYGTGAAGAQPVFTGDYIWTIAVNWAGAWVNEAGRCVGMRGNRGRHYYVAQGADTFEHCQPGQITFELDNHDRRYDPYYASGPLYGSIEPGKPIWVRVKYSGTSYPVFRGTITDIRPITGTNHVQMICSDYLQWMADQTVSYTASSNNQTLMVSDLIRAILIEAKYPYPVNIAASNCPVTYFSVTDANALDTIRELCDAGIGTAYCDADGIFCYRDLSSSAPTSHTVTQDLLLKQIALSQPWENVRNKIKCVANRYGYGPLVEVWRNDEPIYIAAGGTTSIKIEFEECSVVQPVKMVDYMDDARPIVTGGVISYGHYFDAYLSAITSKSATLNIKNSDPTNAQWLAWIAVRGNPLVNKKVTFTATDATSAAKGPRHLVIDSPWLQDRGFASAYTTLLLAHLKDPSKNPIIQFETRGDGLAIDLFHRVTLNLTALGINEVFDVGGIDWEWLNPTGQGFRQTVYLQKILYSSATITPQPFYPGIPAVPVSPGPGGPGGSVSPPGSEYKTGAPSSCLADSPAYGPTGPWTTGENTIITNETGGAAYNCGLWFRLPSNPYRSYVAIDGLWESYSSGAWSKDATWDFDVIRAYDMYDRSIFTGAVASGGMVADGVRYYWWDNTIKYYVKKISFQYNTLGGENEFVRGPLLASGAITVNASAGTTISGLTIGSTYSIEASGTWTRPAVGQKGFQISNNGSNWYGDYGNVLNNWAVPWAGLWEAVGDGHSRYFFTATTTSIKIRAGDNNPPFAETDYTDNATSDFTYALHSTTGGKRVTVRSVKYYNCCEGPASTGYPYP